MRIVVINPNTTASMTAGIDAAARSVARPDAEIVSVTSPMGPVSIESHYDEALAVPGVLAAVDANPGADGYLLACFGDPGLDAAREIAVAPVLGIAEAAMHLAAPLGRGFSIVTTLSRTVGRARDLVDHYGFTRSCRGVHACEIPVLDLDSNPDAADIITAACAETLLHDRSDAIVLGCAGMADLAARIGADIGAPVIDGVAAGVGMLSALASVGARTGTRGGEFAAPPAKRYTGLLEPFARGS
ncbi:Asp/Glu racemase [Gordonia pseudamarae]|jgi:allantoin racemase|uniref:Asp/Glu racemase n=1 Tax=Gordonia pseudamarae TaxID=2831662 RepID=A0ABX6IKZ1_9ACTN|nr:MULTISPECIES: aspartate/glutamate racemase family protein [Gordonia]MBD0021105.1 Asp/Glu racemase [Gordonia sp. (in: high G+C Gram-positive bacteria)]QHN27478.1 Asp/Glu racemase [Gordonia pseudamarae]QHN36362.1 Asp/Glu racemase [Gordonia pseudamarae]